MKGIPHTSSKVTGELKEAVQQLVWYHNLSYSEYRAKNLQKYFVEQRLHTGQLGLNGLAGLLDALGYQMVIKIEKK